MALEIFRLVGSIFVDNEKANKSIAQTDSKAQGVGKTLAQGIGTAAKWGAGIVTGATAAAAALTKLVTSSAETVDNIDKMSQRLGVSRQAYQELDYALSQTGTDVDSFQTGMKSLLKNVDDVAEGNKTASENFQKLGISVLDADGKMRNQEDVLYDTIAAFQQMEDSTEKNRLAQELFGRQGQELMPLLNAEAGSFEELTQKANDLGLVLGDDAIDAGVTLNDTLDTLKRSFDAIVTKLGTSLTPIIQGLADFLIDRMPMIDKLFQQLAPVLFDLLDGVIPPLMQVVDEILPLVLDLLGVLIPLVTDLVAQILPILLQIVRQILPPLIQIVKTILPPVIRLLTPILGLLTPILDLLTPILDVVNILLKPLTFLIDNVLNPLYEIFRKLVEGALKPFVSIWKTVSSALSSVFPSIGGNIELNAAPQMASGGVLKRGQVGFLEGNGAEAVVPLENNRKWTRAVAEDMDGALGDRSVERIEARLADILDALERLLGAGIYLDTGALVGGLAKPLDKQLGRLTALKARA